MRVHRETKSPRRCPGQWSRASAASKLGFTIEERTTSRAAVAVVLIGVAVALCLAPTASARPLITGISNPEFEGAGTDGVLFNRIRNAGARFVHLEVFWNDVAPASAPAAWDPTNPADPNYDWGSVDRRVTAAVNRGLVPHLTLRGAPRWAQGCDPIPPHFAPCDPDPGKLANFATALARRFSGSFGGLPRVRYWEAENEPNLDFFFRPQFSGGKPISPRLYRAIINRFYAAVKGVDRSNVVIAAGLAPFGYPGFNVWPMIFTRKLLCMTGRRHPRPTRGGCKGGVHFDVFSIHPYTEGGPTHHALSPDNVSLGDLPQLQRLLRAADRAGRIRGQSRHTPLWITEFGWDSKPPDPGGLPLRLEARWTAEAIYRAWKAGVSHFYWYQLRDEPRDGLSFSQSIQQGLYLRGKTVAADRPKRILIQAFRFPFVALERRHGFRYWGRTPNSKGGSVRLEVWSGRHWRRAATVRADGSGIFSGVLKSGYGARGRGLVRAVYRKRASVPFSLHYVKDFDHPIYG
jgi:hypothetical protein